MELLNIMYIADCTVFCCSIQIYVWAYHIVYDHALSFFSCQRYARVQYAGALFRTEGAQRSVKHDDANVRMDFTAPGERVIQQAYAKIQSLFVHEAFPGGPRRYVVEGNWFKVVGVCPVAKTTLVRESPSMPFNSSSKFVFLDACYERPVAIWPHDPLGDLPASDPRRDWFDVIDRNQQRSYDC